MSKGEPLSVFDNQVNPLPINEFPEPSVYHNHLTGDSVHYESQAYNVQLGINSLVNAASPLLHLATQLREQHQKPDLSNLHQALCHEVRSFEYRAHACDFPAPVIMGGRYLICCLLDEIILTTLWGRKSEWEELSLLKTFQNESWGGERFFTILERCSQNPSLYIDLLELGYLCLSLGFKGKYQQVESSQHLENIIDNLYTLIRRHRGDFNKLLSPETSLLIQKPSKNIWRLPPIWLTSLLTLLILASVFFPYFYHLNHLSAEVSNLILTPNKKDNFSGNSR